VSNFEPDLIERDVAIAPGTFLPGTNIEVRTQRPGRERPGRPGQQGRIRSALFDFDGTLSLIREGWQQVMVPMMVSILAETPTGREESAAALTALVREFVDRLTGKQTIYQMMQLAEEVRRRGGTAETPLAYKQRYHDLLWQRIERRIAGLRDGSIEPEALRVPGAFAFLRGLKARGVALYLASGTDVAYVRDEAAALGLAPFFAPESGGGGIYGALDDPERFSKAMVIQQILAEHHIAGDELVAFGDGYVEIQNCKDAGGLAVGVASDEVRRQGVDEWKRRRLIQAGADAIVPDFREHGRLLQWLFDE
jgi:phosphoglycolate phosphatase-like HAD superfamily hydrolase